MVTNTALASQYVLKILNSLVGTPSVGNNMQTIRRNRGAVRITDQYVVMFDPS